MAFLKENKYIFIFLFLFIFSSGCVTSLYKINRKYEIRYELKLTPDRVLIQCEKLNDDDDIFYGFMFHVLDDQKTVLSVIQGNRLDKESCFERKEKFEKMFQKSKYIYLTGFGNLNEPIQIDKTSSHIFPKHGTFYGNNRVLQFQLLTNDHGFCFDAQLEDKKPCPSDDFDIDLMKKAE